MIFDFIFSNNFSATWTPQQAVTVLAQDKAFSCKAYSKSGGLGNTRVGAFALFLFQLKTTAVKCTWISTLKSPRESKFSYIPELSLSLARESRNVPHRCWFSVSEWDLPLEELTVPGVSKSIWKRLWKEEQTKPNFPCVWPLLLMETGL